MDVRGICPSLAQEMISEGTEQVIQMDHRTFLKKVMTALGASQPPVFTIIDCGPNGHKVSIKLDVSCARYSVGKKISVVVVESETCQSRVEAEKIAVTKAFKHLSDQHLIKIRDFSSRVADELEEHSAFGYVNSGIYTLEKAIDQWEVVMNKCKAISVQLVGKEANGSNDAEGEEEMYGDLNQFMKMTVEMYNAQVMQARSRATEIETERKMYHSRSTENYHAVLRKGYLQDVYVDSKQVLDYVLTYLGAGKPSYSNGPSDDGMIEGVVVFYMPEIPDVDLCGNLTIRGKATRSLEAEEDAAFKALLYMEKKFKLKIVDLNHAERVAAENEQKLLVRLLEQIVDVGDDVSVYWGKMVKSVATEKSAYPLDATNSNKGPGAAKKRDAYKFCAKCLEDLDKETTERYEACAFRFEELQKLQYKMEELKGDLGMD